MWAPNGPFGPTYDDQAPDTEHKMSTEQRDFILGRIRDLRAGRVEGQSESEQFCWRPSGDLTEACLLVIGHVGPCGWERGPDFERLERYVEPLWAPKYNSTRDQPTSGGAS